VAEVVERIGEVGALGELEIRLVEDDDGTVGHTRHEVVDLVGGHDGRRGVVRVGDEDHLGHRRHGARHRLEVEAVVLERHDHADAADGLDDHGVDDERGMRDHRLLPRPEKCPREQLDEIVRAIAEDDVLRAEPVTPTEGLPQIVAAAVGIAVEMR
jgi:hypothetical protein